MHTHTHIYTYSHTHIYTYAVTHAFLNLFHILNHTIHTSAPITHSVIQYLASYTLMRAYTHIYTLLVHTGTR